MHAGPIVEEPVTHSGLCAYVCMHTTCTCIHEELQEDGLAVEERGTYSGMCVRIHERAIFIHQIPPPMRRICSKTF